MRQSAAVVVIGAGIVGCSVAYHLTRLGCRDVLVVDQGPLFATGGSTSHAPGNIFQTSVSRMMTLFARETVETLAALDLDGEPVLYPVGSLEVATTPERLRDLKRKLGWAKTTGVDASLLTADDAAALLPLLDRERVLGAFHVPTDGVTRAVAAAEALARRASQDGAEFVGRTRVTGIEVAGGRVQGVATDRGQIAAENVVICAGIWGPTVGALADVSIPLTPIEHQLVWTTPLPELAGETREVVHPILRHQDRDLYFRQRRDGYAVGSYAHEPRMVDPATIPAHDGAGPLPSIRPFTPDDFAPAWRDAVDLLPALAETQVAEALNGMFSFTPDSFPILGEAGDVRGCWVAEAIWVMHSGGAGKALAEWIVEGRPRIDVHEADVNRFEPHAATRRYILARGAQQYREVYDVIHPLQPLTSPRGLRTSPFAARQRELGAVFFEGRGWEQPRWYEANASLLDEHPVRGRDGWAGCFWSPIAAAEHLATRDRAGLFDMSPLTKLEVSGPGACAFLERVTTNRIDRPVGAVTYALLLDEAGGVLSDVTVTRLDEDRFQIGGNGPQDLAWLRRCLSPGEPVTLRNVTGAWCCLGLWGPRAREILAPLTSADLASTTFPYYSARAIDVGEVPVTALRVSYVGELGWELYASPEYGARLWDLLWQSGQPLGLIAAGRAAFDSLRIEKGYRLWGVDMHAELDAAAAGVSFAVRSRKPSFTGREAYLRSGDGGQQRLACLVLDDQDAVMMGKEPVLAGQQCVGYVTSAAFGPSVARSIAYAIIPADLAAEGTRLTIESFGEPCAATVARDPLFDPEGTRLRV